MRCVSGSLVRPGTPHLQLPLLGDGMAAVVPFLEWEDGVDLDLAVYLQHLGSRPLKKAMRWAQTRYRKESLPSMVTRAAPLPSSPKNFFTS